MPPARPIDGAKPPAITAGDDTARPVEGDTGGVPEPFISDDSSDRKLIEPASPQPVALPAIGRPPEWLDRVRAEVRIMSTVVASADESLRGARMKAAMEFLLAALDDLRRRFHPEKVRAGSLPDDRTILRSLRSAYHAQPKAVAHLGKTTFQDVVRLFGEPFTNYLHENAQELGLLGAKAPRRRPKATRIAPSPRARQGGAASAKPQELPFADTATVEMPLADTGVVSAPLPLTRKQARHLAAHTASILERTALAFDTLLAALPELFSEFDALERRRAELLRDAEAPRELAHILPWIRKLVAYKDSGQDLSTRLRAAGDRLTFLLEAEQADDPTLPKAQRAYEIAVREVSERTKVELRDAWEELNTFAAEAAKKPPEIEARLYRLGEFSAEIDRAMQAWNAEALSKARKDPAGGKGGSSSPAGGTPSSSDAPPDNAPPAAPALPSTAPSSWGRIEVVEGERPQGLQDWAVPGPADLPELGAEAMLPGADPLQMNHAAAAAAVLRMPIAFL